MADLLLEIGTEEIPAGYIEPALQQMKRLLSELLSERSLGYGEIKTTATPRRLAIFVSAMPERQENTTVEITGPPAHVAFDANGKPTKAAKGFASAQGVPVATLEAKETNRGRYCVAVKHVAGRATIELLPEILTQLIGSIGFPKSMVWKGRAVRFARPIRSILALFGKEVVPVEVAGVRSGRSTEGHPFLSSGAFELERADFESYRNELRRRNVTVDSEERMESIRREVLDILSRHEGVFDYEELLREVANLVEWPHAVEGSFPPEFLRVPAAVAEAAMMEHQRYFPVKTSKGELRPVFVVVSNRTSKSADIVREGNERVLRARLEDACFFYDDDRKRRLEEYLPGLEQLLFMKGVGGYLEKVRRLEKLAEFIAWRMGLSKEVQGHAIRAAHLCKADLVTQMVGEFPSLQGIIGGIYAAGDGEGDGVATAISEQYQPRHVADRVPSTLAGMVVSLADKLDNVISCFAGGRVPSGSQDPYGLRRQGSGIIRILEVADKSLSLRRVIERGIAALPKKLREKAGGDTTELLLGFFRDRLYNMCIERGLRYDIVNSVLAAGFDDIADYAKRLKVVVELSQGQLWEKLVYLVQRSNNVMKIGQAAEKVSADLFEQDEERELWTRFREKASVIRLMLDCANYDAASRFYCECFAKPVHEFFDKVFVNVNEEEVKRNRIRLVKEINELFSRRIADLSEVVIEGENAK